MSPAVLLLGSQNLKDEAQMLWGVTSHTATNCPGVGGETADRSVHQQV